jgi:3-hydroxyacyl-[acyl-carrier-protein] dehydratase
MTNAVPSEADIQLIRRAIPHRYPLLLVDRVREIVPFVSAVGVKNVTFNEPHFAGHFPAEPVMPGVMIVEAMAQVASVMVSLSHGLADSDALVYFMGIEGAKFRRKVVPGDVMEMAVEVTRGREGGKVWRFRGTATVEGDLAAEAEFTAMLILPKAAEAKAGQDKVSQDKAEA